MTYARLDDLAEAVEAWSAEHGIKPLSGQAGEVLTLRNLRYYRTLGLIDGPVDGAYSEKHFLQLASVRVLQAKGQPLKVIQRLLFGRSPKELKRVLDDGASEIAAAGSPRGWNSQPTETWATFGLPGDWLLVSRRGQTLDAERLRLISDLLSSAPGPISTLFPTSSPHAKSR